MAVTGFVEHADTTRVSGWAYDSGAPEARLEVTVRIGDQFYASGFADIARGDLLAAGIGDGKHGFVIDVSETHFSAEEAAALEVHAISGVEIVRIARVEAMREPIVDLKSDPQMPISDTNQFPVFILGPARFGANTITQALLESGSYLGTGDGQLLPLAHGLLSTIDSYYQRAGNTEDTALSRVSIDAFQKLVRRCFIQLAADLFPTTHWLDKTPTVEMARAAVLMSDLWPNSRFIFVKERVIEHVINRRREFPHDTTEGHYSDWAAVMTTWVAVRGQLGSGALEIDQRQLAVDPEGVASLLAEFLELPEAAADRFSRYICASQPEQQTDKAFAVAHSLEQLGLDEYHARCMTAACDRAMTAFGYGYGESYHITGTGT